MMGTPDQLLLEKELEQWNAAVEQVLQHKDVDPRLVVATDHVPAVAVQGFEALHIPLGALG